MKFYQKVFIAFFVVTVLYTEEQKKNILETEKKTYPNRSIEYKKQKRKEKLYPTVGAFWLIFWGLYFYFIINHLKNLKIEVTTLGQEMLALEDRANALI